jgi:hypothetical protein
MRKVRVKKLRDEILRGKDIGDEHFKGEEVQGQRLSLFQNSKSSYTPELDPVPVAADSPQLPHQGSAKRIVTSLFRYR